MDRITKYNKISGRIYIAAWLMEITAAAIGALIGITFLLRIPDDNRDLISYLPVLGFFMIALVELTRIPFSQVIYYKKKLIFVPVLFLMIFLNFETMWVSFNIYTNSVTKNATLLYNDLQNLKKQNLINDDAINIASITSIDDIQNEYKQNLDLIENTEQNELDLIDQRLESLILDNPEIIKTKTEITTLVERKRNLISNIDQIKADASKNEEKIRKEIKETIKRNSIEISRLKKDRKELNVFSGGQKSKIDDQVEILQNQNNKLNSQLASTNIIEGDQTLLNYQKEIKEIDNNILNKQKEITDLQFNTDNKNLSKIESLNEEKSLIIKKYNEQRKQLLDEYNISKNKLNSDKENIEQFRNDIQNINIEINENEKLFIEEAEKLPIYWFAKSLSGKESFVEVSPKDIDFTVLIWFGTLSLVIATAGTALAFASFVMGDNTVNQRGSIRSLLLTIIRNQRKPRIKIEKEIIEKEKIVEKIKHVPEEKVVFKEVPKIQEVIKKEIVHVPVPTAREDLINSKNDK